jgi:hypothetical protein
VNHHPYFDAVLPVVIGACIVLGFGAAACWVSWRDAVERRRDARARRARMDAQRAWREGNR